MGKLSSLIRFAASPKRFNSAVILAAGSGTRFGDDRAKQFIELEGLPVIVRSAMAFEKSHEIHEIVVVTKEADIDGCRALLMKHGITKLTKVVSGGDTRQESAKRGFDSINPECDYVAIHDAARCLVTTNMIESAIEAAYVSGAAACAVKVTDTLKRTNGNNVITETIERENAWRVQTPQVFLADMYRAASYTAKKENIVATDDCALCERLGFQVRLVDCGQTNIKITYPEDILIAKAILESRKNDERKLQK